MSDEDTRAAYLASLAAHEAAARSANAEMAGSVRAMRALDERWEPVSKWLSERTQR